MAPTGSKILLLVGVIFGLVSHPTEGHLCIISPHQRGPLDVSHVSNGTSSVELIYNFSHKLVLNVQQVISITYIYSVRERSALTCASQILGYC